ncbi:siderophore-interacting protein [Subtercola frigoramans]|uniref:NADPH-dependent ferric siderophore reductase n=1 Tax=Subtercola frigoramans TaxID=120298 RepID=A0ABS2L6V6_9MICO|nr:siderophore-interacting protein [Subtercola frigoramans]MBM7472460.1 NADPH-dependent ferric siderophore reductase [Subtercola frigoramans]
MSSESPFVLARVRVATVDRLSPSFIRIGFRGSDLDDVGTPGQVFDQRIKLIFPAASGELPSLSGDAGWYQEWLALPEDSRGSIRTYSIRDLVVDGGTTTVVIDFVLHLDPEASGPASSWANDAAVGDHILLLGPRRGRTDGGGIEYSPGSAGTVVLAGDETAAPAIARILGDADRAVRGVAFIEVPHHDDVLAIDAPAGVEVRWLPRAELPHGGALQLAVLDYLGAGIQSCTEQSPGDELLWETPTYSGLGESLGDGGHPAERYYWIAGESGVVTTLRRHLVKDLGVSRSQVAFMGYWRKGVAMRG